MIDQSHDNPIQNIPPAPEQLPPPPPPLSTGERVRSIFRNFHPSLPKRKRIEGEASDIADLGRIEGGSPDLRSHVSNIQIPEVRLLNRGGKEAVGVWAPASPIYNNPGGIRVPGEVSVTDILTNPFGVIGEKIYHTLNKPDNKVESGTDKVGRRMFIIKAGQVLSLAVDAAVINEWNNKTRVFNKIGKSLAPLSPDVKIVEEIAVRNELNPLFIFDGHNEDPKNDGVGAFVKTMTNSALSFNNKSEIIDAANRETWEGSQFLGFMEGFNKFFKDALTEEGRKRIASAVSSFGMPSQVQGLSNFQKYLDSNSLKNIDLPTLKKFCLDSKEIGGLGYGQEDIELIFGVLNSYRNGNITVDQITKLNAINEKMDNSSMIPYKSR